VESFQEELTEKISKIRESNRELENTLRKISNAPDRCVCVCARARARACACVRACLRVNEVWVCVFFFFPSWESLCKFLYLGTVIWFKRSALGICAGGMCKCSALICIT
jgi:hypothetical protein